MFSCVFYGVCGCLWGRDRLESGPPSGPCGGLTAAAGRRRPPLFDTEEGEKKKEEEGRERKGGEEGES